MADQPLSAPKAPSVADGFLADRLSFWTAATKFMTKVIIGIFVLLMLLWWFLV